MARNFFSALRKHIQRHPADTFLLGCFLGALFFVLLYGVKVLDFTYDAWLLDSSRTEKLWDLTQHYLGWVYYRNTPWQFPIGLTEGLYQTPVSVIYTDSIPLFAVFFKLLSPLLPETFQYFGLFGLICCVLTGGFGALIPRRFSKNVLVNSMCALFFLLSPVLLKRMFYHTALAAHFLILAAFALWLYRPDILRKHNRGRFVLYWGLLCALSVWINAYFTPMILGLCFCCLLQEAIAEKKIRLFVPGLCAPVFATLVFAWIIGLFYGNVTASSQRLSDLSHNLLAWLNPGNYLLEIHHRKFMFSPQNYSAFLPALPDVSPWQQEGFAYLGLGVLFLLAVLPLSAVFFRISGIRRHPSDTAAGFPASDRPQISKKRRLRCSWIVSILLCAFVFLFLALSPKATVGDHVLYEIDYPDGIYRLLSIFRSTGRLIWPVYYGVMILLFTALIRLFSNKRHGFFCLTLLLFAGLLIQTADLSPALRWKHEAYAKEYEMPKHPFTSPAWEVLGASADSIMFYTPTHRGLQCDPEISCLFEEYALAYDLSLNVTYMSRDMTKEADAATKKTFSTEKKRSFLPEHHLCLL